MIASNKKFFEKSAIVSYYTKLSGLLKEELLLLQLLSSKLSNMRMLDIGVGAGRTTQYFATQVGEYVGIDYSASMIKACNKRFSNMLPNAKFILCDVTNMYEFENESFDFILFSYNGIDCITNYDLRCKALSEIHRICRPCGIFAFTSHNLSCIRSKLYPSISRCISSAGPSFFKAILLRLFNPHIKELSALNWSIIKDEAHLFRLRSFYVKPSFQICQCQKIGFSDIAVYTHSSCERIYPGKDPNCSNEPWLCYYCTK